MAWLVFCGLLFYPVPMYSCIWDRMSSALLCLLYQYSFFSSIQISAQATSSSQFPCGCCAAGSISASVIKKVLLFLWLLQPQDLSWANLCLTDQYFCMVCAMSFFCVASHGWYTLWGGVGGHLGDCFLYVFYGCAHLQVYWCVDSVNIYA